MSDFTAKLTEIRRQLRAYARQFLRPEEEAFTSDLIQDTLEVAARRAELIKSLNSEEAFAWLRATFENKARNRRRAEHRLKRDRGRDRRLDDAVSGVLVDDGTLPPTVAERAELAERVDRALMRDLSDDQRWVVILYYFRKWTHAEIAEVLDLDRSTVSKLLARALRKLQKCGLLSIDDLA